MDCNTDLYDDELAINKLRYYFGCMLRVWPDSEVNLYV